MALIGKLFWFAIFLAATFGFTVLFEHGPENFKENSKVEFKTLKEMVMAKPEKKKDESDKLTPPIK